MLKKLSNNVVAFLYVFVMAILKNVAQAVWDGMWQVLFEAVEEAEERWNEEGYSEEKKAYVMDKVTTFVEENTENMFFIRKQAVRLFLSWSIDGVIKAIEDELGENWVESVKEYKDQMSDFVSFLNEERN